MLFLSHNAKAACNVFKAASRNWAAQLALMSEAIVCPSLRKETYFMWNWIGKAIVWKIITAIWRTVFKKVG